MKTLHSYLVREICATLVMTVAVFTFVLLLANVLKEIIGMLISAQLPFTTVLLAITLLIPFVLVYALPMGMLTGTLLVFGRFSADNEFTAIRASGISLISVISPVLLLSVFLSGVCALVNMEIAPQCRVAYKQLLWSTGVSRAGAFLPEKAYIKDFPGYVVYLGSVKGTNLKDILIYKLDAAKDRIDWYMRASEGRLKTASNIIELQLFDAWRVDLSEGTRVPVSAYASEGILSYTNTATTDTEHKLSLSDMTFQQLRAELRSIERKLTTSVPLGKMSNEALRQRFREYQQEAEDLTSPIKVQIHRQAAFSFACIGFTLIGIPLGLRAHRRETTFGIAVALMLVIVYYSFFILGQSLETEAQYFPHLILWLPNFIFQAIGAVLLWRANRGF